MTEPTKPQLVGPKILLQGDSGSGKTTALATLVNWAAKQNPVVEVFVLFTENGLESLVGWWTDPPVGADGKPIRPAQPVPANLHWHVIKGLTLDLKDMKESAQKVGNLTYLGLTTAVDASRGLKNPGYAVLTALEDFPDDRTGKKFGNIGTWGVDKCLGIDSLSELCTAYVKMTIGNKPVMAQNEYGVAQNNLMNLIGYLTQGLAATFVMTAHLQRQTNELTGSVQLMTKGIGKAMADDIPQKFSEVLYCYRDGLNWFWDTSAPNVTTKTRYLPIKAKITPDLGVIMDKWKLRNAV